MSKRFKNSGLNRDRRVIAQSACPDVVRLLVNHATSPSNIK